MNTGKQITWRQTDTQFQLHATAKLHGHTTTMFLILVHSEAFFLTIHVDDIQTPHIVIK